MSQPSQNTLDNKFEPFRQRMLEAGMNEIILNNFRYYYNQLRQGEVGYIPESEIQTVEDLPDSQQLGSEDEKLGRQNLKYTVVIKLNGGLGTSMGLNKAKSLLPVKNGRCFLDIIALQTIKQGARLLLMNSFSTRQDSLNVLSNYDELQGDIPLDFLQHKIPKVAADDFSPVHFPDDPDLEWCPPGHGDLYISMVTSGVLESLLKNDYRYAFVSNVDNLGAVLQPSILGYVVRNELEFLMEVAERTPADRKGGHLAKRGDSYILREIAQCPEEDVEHFQNIERHRYFNTNNLWIDLLALQQHLEQKEYMPKLPLIVNQKTVNPRDADSQSVFQLETAMGAAISLYDRSAAVRVPRTRFAPVKSTNDLLLVRSDYYQLNDDYLLVPHPNRACDKVVVDLDKTYYKMIDDFDTRFPKGVPSMVAARSLQVNGNVVWGKDIRIQGDVQVNGIESVKKIADDAVLEGTVNL